MPYSRTTFITASNASYALPAGWNNSDNLIECIGRGGKGSARNASNDAGNGGGGGAYCSGTNQNLGAGPIAVQVGTNASAVVTWVKNTGGTVVVQADYGRDATTTALGAGGVIANNIPVSTGFKGGDGAVNSTSVGGGGGGAGGPSGAGGNGGVTQAYYGGTGNNATEAQQTTQGAEGNVGTEWDSTHGCGGGGAGGSGSGQKPGGAGGGFTRGWGGGGGGGSNDGSTAQGGAGTTGLIILRDNPTGPAAGSTGFFGFM